VAKARDWQRLASSRGSGRRRRSPGLQLLSARHPCGPDGARPGRIAGRCFATFSAALLLTPLVGPRVGQTIDRFGGREVLAASNLLFAGGLGPIAVADSEPILWMAWLILGLGTGLGLYDTAFATLGRLYGETARGAITGVTLFAGFARTVGWPLTAWGETALGLRGLGLHAAPDASAAKPVAAKTARQAVTIATPAKPHVATARRMRKCAD
jgi:MFS family permease